MARWTIALHAHVGMRVEVEADTRQEAWQKAKEIAAKKSVPRPQYWTPVMTSRIDEKS